MGGGFGDVSPEVAADGGRAPAFWSSLFFRGVGASGVCAPVFFRVAVERPSDRVRSWVGGRDGSALKSVCVLSDVQK